MSPSAADTFSAVGKSRPSLRRRSTSSGAVNATLPFDGSNDASCVLEGESILNWDPFGRWAFDWVLNNLLTDMLRFATTPYVSEHMISVDDLESFMKSPTKTGVSKRQLACAEMLQTEKNYVKSLEVIIAVSRFFLGVWKGAACLNRSWVMVGGGPQICLLVVASRKWAHSAKDQTSLLNLLTIRDSRPCFALGFQRTAGNSRPVRRLPSDANGSENDLQ